MDFTNQKILIYGPGIKEINDFNTYDYIIIFNEQYKLLDLNIFPNNKKIILFINVGMIKSDNIIKKLSILSNKLYKIFYKDDIFLENISLADSKYNTIRDNFYCLKRPWSSRQVPRAPAALGLFWILNYFLFFKGIKCYITGIDFYKRNISYDKIIKYNYTIDKKSRGFKYIHNPNYQIYIFKNMLNKYKNIILLDDFLKNILTNLK